MSYTKECNFWKIVKSIIICFSFASMLFSCSSKPRKPHFKIGFSQCIDDAWRPKMDESMDQEILLQKEFDVDLIIKNVHFNSNLQLTHIRELVSEGIDILIITPNEVAGLVSLIDSLYNSGLPIIILDRTISSDNFTAYIGANNYLIGTEVGKLLEEFAIEHQKIWEITGQLFSSPAIERSAGFRDEFHLQGIPIITVESNWEENDAFEKADSLLNIGITPDIVYAHNDFMAKGVYNALQKHQKKAIIIGVDGLPDVGLKMVEEGVLNATFLYPSGGDRAIDLALNILSNKKYEKYNYLNTLRIDSRNVRTLLLQQEIIASQQTKIDKQRAYDIQLSNRIRQTQLFFILALVIIGLLITTTIIIFLLLKQKGRINREISNKRMLIETQNEKIVAHKENLIRMVKIAEEATDSKLRFFTNISHEFKTLLSLIIFPTEDLLKENVSEDDRIEKAMHIKKNVNRLTKLTEDLISFRALDKNKYVQKIENTNISKIVNEIVLEFKNEAQAKGLLIESHIEKEVVRKIDKGALEKILFNLLSNAIKYTHKGSIKVSLNLEEDKVYLKVEDSGIGISQNEKNLIFNRFYRSNSNESIKSKGSGIGLSLCQELVEMQNGKISFESKIGIGTVFTVILPTSPMVIIDDDIIASDTNYANRKVLLVEDNEELRDMLVDKLRENFIVMAVENGQEAFESLKDEIPDIVVSDVLMPVMDGLELCKRIKEIKDVDIPVILITALNSPRDSIKGFDLGADAYISKPLSVELLVSRIKNILHKKENEAANKISDIVPFKFIEGKSIKEQKFINECAMKICEEDNGVLLSAKDLSRSLNLSHSTLFRRIKSITGLKVVDFMKKIRLEYAAQLLLKTNLQIKEIAWKIGFEDQKYFSKCFKEQFGSSPSDFKRS